MAILEQTVKTLRNYITNDIEQALIDILIAIDATSKREYPVISGNAARFTKFLDDNRFLIQLVSLNVRMTNPISFRNMHSEERLKNQSRLTLSQIIYHVIRCNLLHEAELPISIGFTESPEIRLEPEKMVLPKLLILALLIAVVGAKSNTDNRFNEDFTINIWGRTLRLNEIWGKGDLAIEILNQN